MRYLRSHNYGMINTCLKSLLIYKICFLDLVIQMLNRLTVNKKERKKGPDRMKPSVGDGNITLIVVEYVLVARNGDILL